MHIHGYTHSYFKIRHEEVYKVKVTNVHIVFKKLDNTEVCFVQSAGPHFPTHAWPPRGDPSSCLVFVPCSMTSPLYTGLLHRFPFTTCFCHAADCFGVFLGSASQSTSLGAAFYRMDVHLVAILLLGGSFLVVVFFLVGGLPL